MNAGFICFLCSLVMVLLIFLSFPFYWLGFFAMFWLPAFAASMFHFNKVLNEHFQTNQSGRSKRR